MSSGRSPDDGRFATTSWRQSRHDQINQGKFQIIKLSFAWGALALQIIIILVKLCDFLPAKIKTKNFFIKR
jgi:hypothetical protein